ncbi:hypothetical protein P4O66_018133 [Electrophorus voltai]|uniref:Uncharacterized protein n=1 Tax=Electrophorus voltai TaxID=2609070 RepID=A0AAD8YUV3_9TELE|nr:hypothetical protein P4O66_018133 [Electrophorus voltai]
MGSADILNSGTSFYFSTKLLFSAHQNFILSRGHKPILPNKSSSYTDFWKIKPPDFSPKLYRSLNLPRIKKKNLNLAKLTDDWAEMSQRTDKMYQIISSKPEQKRTEPPLMASYRSPGSLELKLLFVKSGKHPSIPYKDPKPHNFRPVDEKLPDMVFSIEKDPGNVNFKTQLLGAITGIQSEPNLFQRETLRKLNTFKPAEPKWDASLMLPRSPWPPKSASYTRHQRRRGVYSALMDRVEEKLSSTCIKEQYQQCDVEVGRWNEVKVLSNGSLANLANESACE